MGSLMEYNSYSNATKALIAAFLVLPPLINYFGQQIHHDAIIVSIELILLGYVLPIFIMYNCVDKGIWLKAAHVDLDDTSSKRTAAIIQGVIYGVVIGAILILYCKYVDFGPQTIILPFPFYTDKTKRILYWVAFTIVWGIILPMAEVTFYFMFQAACWGGLLSDLVISLAYAIMNFCWMYWVIEKFWWAFSLAAFTFALGYFLIKIRDSKGGMAATGIRIGISLGTIALLVFIYQWGKCKVPQLFVVAHPKNKFF